MMKKFSIISVLIITSILSSCDYMPFSNVCADKKVIEEVKLHTAGFVWVMENPGDAFLTYLAVGLSMFSGDTEKLEHGLLERIKPIMEGLKVEDVAKAQKLSEGQYRCSAVFSYKEKKLAVVYNINQVHSGKEKIYRVDVQDITVAK